MSSRSWSRRSISKQRGAEMSSRLIPPKLGASRAIGLDELVGVRAVQADRHRVDATELLEQHRLALHHRHRRRRPDVAEPEHGGPVGDDRDRVGHPGVVARRLRVLGDRQADPGDSGRVRHRQVVGVAQRDAGRRRAACRRGAASKTGSPTSARTTRSASCGWDGARARGLPSCGSPGSGRRCVNGDRVAVRRSECDGSVSLTWLTPGDRPELVSLPRPRGVQGVRRRGHPTRRQRGCRPSHAAGSATARATPGRSTRASTSSSGTRRRARSRPPRRVVALDPPAVRRMPVTRLTATGRSGRRTTASSPGRGATPYRTSSRSPAYSVGSIERPRTTASPIRGPCGRVGPRSHGHQALLGSSFERSRVGNWVVNGRHQPTACNRKDQFMLARFIAPTIEVSAHCDLPCGVYDPAQARIEAESVKAIIGKVADNDDPDFRTRAVDHQGAALGARQAPPVGALDRLLQAPALREVPAAAHAGQRGDQARRRHAAPRAAWTRPRPTSCWPRSTRSPRSSRRPRRADRSPTYAGPDRRWRSGLLVASARNASATVVRWCRR